MVPFNKIQKGLANYLDNEVMPSFKDEGWKRVAAGAAIALTIQRAEKFLPIIQSNQFITTMGLVDAEGNFDIEALIPVVKDQIRSEPMVLNVPLLGKLIFKENDVDKLADYINTAKV